MLLELYPPWLLRIAAFLLGSLVGSFLNVAIYRWPREMSVVTPPSHCPGCGTPIPFFRNVPIFAYFWMRGRAPCCGERLTLRYVVVEVLAAFLFLAVVDRWVIGPLLAGAPSSTGLWVGALCLLVFFSGLLVVTFVDLEWMEIPDEVTLPGMSLGLVAASFSPNVTAAEAALGAGAGYLVVQMVFVWGWERLTGQRGMGEGDSKLMLLIGAFAGWKGAAFALLAGAFQGLFAFLLARVFRRDFKVQTPNQVYGTIHVPGGKVVVDVAELCLSEVSPGHLLLRSGTVELQAEKDGDAAVSVSTPVGTVRTSPGASAGLMVKDDGSLVVEVYAGAVQLFVPSLGGPPTEAPIAADRALLVRADGTFDGPCDLDALPSGALAPAPKMTPDQVAKRIEESAEQLVNGALASEHFLAAFERHRVLCWIGNKPVDSSLLASLREKLPVPLVHAPASVPAPTAQPSVLPKGPSKLPFGPFLSISALEYLFFGDELIALYRSLFW